MDNILFYNSFSFCVPSIKHYSHTDNSKGIDCHFLARMLCGKARIVTGPKEELLLEAGDVFYLPLGLRYHSYWYGDPAKGDLVTWESYRFSVFPDKDNRAYVPQKLFPDKDSLALLDEMAESKTVSPLFVGKLYLFLGRMLPSMKEDVRIPQRALIEKAKRYIEDNPSFKVRELAAFCNMSESGLYAFLNRYLHCSPIDIKNNILAEKAVALLQSTNLSVEEISTALNFCNSAYFRKIFKKQTGKTPTEIRKNGSLI